MHPLVALLVLGACAPGGDDAAATVVAPCTDCALTDEHQFAYEADLFADVVHLAAGEDAVVRWDGLTRDLHGHPRDAVEDIDEAWLVAFRGLGPQEILEGLAHDELTQSAISLFVTCTPTDAGCALSDFALLGGSVDVVPAFQEGDTTWLVVLSSPLEAGSSTLVVIQPDAASDADEAVIDDETGALDVEVDFAGAEPILVAPHTTGLVIDWSGVTRDGLGNALRGSSVDGLFLGRYSSPREELEGKVFDLEDAAAESWEMPLDGSTHADLSELTGETPFVGIADGSTWLLALRCSSCINPAPRLVSFLAAAP